MAFLFVVYTRTYRTFYLCFLLAEAAFQGIVTIGVNNGSLIVDEVDALIRDYCSSEIVYMTTDRRKRNMAVDLRMAVDDLDAARFNNLLNRFEESPFFSLVTERIV